MGVDVRRDSLILRGLREPIVAIDLDLQVIAWNAAAADRFGLREDEALGRPLAECFRAPDPAALLARIRLAPPNAELEMPFVVRQDVADGPATAFVTGLSAEDGALCGLLARFPNAARTADTLRRERLILAESQELAHLGSFEWNLHANTIYWSDELFRIYGLAPTGEPVDMAAFVARVHPDDRARVGEVIQAALRDRSVFQTEERIVRPDGTIRVLESRGRVLCDATGQPERMVGACLDVTERRLAEDAGRASELRFRALVENASDAFFLHDDDGTVLDVNRQACDSLGYTRDELVGMSPTQFDPLVDAAGLAELLLRLDDHESITFDSQHRRKDGTVFPVEVRLRPFLLGGKRRCVGLVRDIAHRKRNERTLVRNARVMELIATGAPLTRCLDEITALIEERIDDACCLIVRADGPGVPLRVKAHGAMADELAAALSHIDGAALQDVGNGSPAVELLCDDRDDDARWAALVGLMRRQGLATCWFMPIPACAAEADGRGRRPGAAALLLLCRSRDPLGANDRDAIAAAALAVRIAMERSCAIDDLRASEQRFRELADAMPQLVWTADASGVCNYGNRRLLETLRIDDPTRWFDWIHAEDRDRVVACWLRSISTGEPYLVDYRLRVAATDQYRWYLGHAVAARDADGAIKCWYGAAADIDHLKQIDSALRAREAQLEAFFDTSNAGMTEFMADGRFLRANDAFCRMVGYSREELLARSIVELLHPEDKDAACADMELLRSGAARQFRANRRYCTRDGATIYTRVHVTAAHGEDGRPAVFAGVVIDVTAEKKLEDRLRQSQKMEAIGQLAGGIAHDFNNLLTVISGHSEILADSIGGDVAVQESATAIRDAAERATTLTAQLLAFSRRAIIEPRILDLNLVVESTSRMLRRLIGEDITLLTQLSPTLGRVRMDAGQLEQVLINLAVNARDAMPVGGRLTIETRDVWIAEPTLGDVGEARPGRHAQVMIADTGHGMTAEVKARMFEPFFTTKGVGKGTGLGLATVYGIVQQAGGSISVESEVGRGTRIFVLLAAVTEAPSGAPGEVGSVPNGPETILLVEDEDAVRRLARLFLARYGYTVIDAASGAEAIRLAGDYHGRVDLLLTDVVMPDIGGHSLAEALRAERPDIQVLYMSGYMDDHVVRHGVETARDAFLHKPFTPIALARKVREVLDARVDRPGAPASGTGDRHAGEMPA